MRTGGARAARRVRGAGDEVMQPPYHQTTQPPNQYRTAAQVVQPGSALQVVAQDLAVQGGTLDLQDRRGLALVPVGVIQGAQDVLFLDFFQRKRFVGRLFGACRVAAEQVQRGQPDVAGVEQRAGAQGDGTFDDVAQLADVAGPVV